MIRDTIKSINLQRRVIWALMLREMLTRYGRENIGFLWIVGEPILFCAGVTIGWSLIRSSHEHGIPMPAFVLTGYVPLTMWRHCVSRGIKAFESNGALFFHRQVSPFDVLTARCLLECIGSLLAGFIIMCGCIILGYMTAPIDTGLLYLGLIYQVLFSFATSLLIACLTEYSEVVEKAVQIVMYLSIPLSGAFVMVDWISEKYQWILLLSPMVDAVEMIRGGQFGPGVHPHYLIWYATWSIALMLLVGVSLTLRVKRHLVIQ